MKKLFLLLVVASMITVFSLVGCKEAIEEEPPEEAVEEEVAEEATEEVVEEEEVIEPVTLSMLIFDSDMNDGLQAQIDALKKELNVTIELEVTPRAEGDVLITSRLATGEMNDIFIYNTGALLQTLNPAEVLVDISDQPFAANITDEYKNSASVDGVLYGVPASPGTVGGVVYNTDIYDELGLDIPLTWDQFIENCKQIKDAEYIPVLGSYGDSWTAQLLVLADNYNVIAYEPNFADDYTANKAHFSDTPAALRSFEKLESVYKEGLLNNDFATVTFDDAQRMFAEGNVAHYPMLSFIFANLDENYPDSMEFTGMFPEPSDDENINGITSWGVINGWYVPKTCKNMDAAMKVLEFFTSQEGIDAYATGRKISGPLAVTGLTLPANTLGVVSQIQVFYDEGRTTPALEYLSPIKGPNLPQICVEVGSGIKAALDGAQAYDEDVKAQAQQLGLEGW